VFGWLKKGKVSAGANLKVDMHSHLIPAIDDGVRTNQESLEIIQRFEQLGYEKLITTPHVMSHLHRNTTEGIRSGLAQLNTFLADQNTKVKVEAAAEYYLDETLIHMLQNNEPLLTMGKNYLLFETNFLNEPFNLKDFIFLATTKGYKLIMAHPERYMYLQSGLEKAEDLLTRGVLFQVNIGSIAGSYSKAVQNTAFKLIDKGWVHLLGSDCHNLQHIKQVEQTQRSKYFQKALALPLLNNML
jgi:tyrosine-protein phosphatase YwqE